MSTTPEDPDGAAIRQAAFQHVKGLQELHEHLTSADLLAGFRFQGERVPLVNPQRGIFKPRRMRFLLSIRTVYPRTGARVWYDDQREVHRQIYQGEEAVDYAFMGDDPGAADNRWLKEAADRQVPVLYFLGIAPGRYQAFTPVFIRGWNAQAKKVTLVFGMPGSMELADSAIDRRYALRLVKQRLHQASFREAVMAAYQGRCALSGLPEPLLLDAAHILPDADEFGLPIVQNGIPMSKVHHAAFDGHLIGIDPDHRIHVSERLLSQRDGPMLESLKALHGGVIHPPMRERDCPDRDRLAARFELFKAAA